MVKTGPRHRWSFKCQRSHKKDPPVSSLSPLVFQNHLHPSFRTFVKMLTPGPGVPPLWPRTSLAKGPRFPPRCVWGCTQLRNGAQKAGC